MHTHLLKTEDFINCVGATLLIELSGSDKNGNIGEIREGTVFCDGIQRNFGADDKFHLAHGESVTLMPGDWHAYSVDSGSVLIGEVSTAKDDEADDIFRESIGRFVNIGEDVDPSNLLVRDYRAWLL